MMRGDDLYENVKQLEQDWLKTNIQTLIMDSISSSLIRAQNSTDAQGQSSERREAGEKFLSALKDAWEDHQLCMGMVTDVLMYMVGLSEEPLDTCCDSLPRAGPHDHHSPYQTIHLRDLYGIVPRQYPPVPHPIRLLPYRRRYAYIDYIIHDLSGTLRSHH